MSVYSSQWLRLTLLTLTLTSGTALAAAPLSKKNAGRRLFLEELVHPEPSFVVDIEVNHRNRVYQGGDTLSAKVRSSRNGFLYLFNCDVEGNVWCLFPNKHQRDNAIQANRPITIPASKKLRIRVGPPYGLEVLKAIVTTKPITTFEVEKLITAAVTPVTPTKGKRLFLELVKEKSDYEWAEHSVTLRTLDPKKQPPVPRPKGKRRVGLFIGISYYESNRIRRSPHSYRDATTLGSAMRKHAQLDQAFFLSSRNANRANIQMALSRTLPERTSVGDTIFIYYSGHSIRWTGGNKKLHDYLLPFDTNPSSKASITRTAISDVLLTRWLQCLEGRQVILILDTSPSRTVSHNGKEIQPVPVAFMSNLTGNIRTLRSYGQTDISLLIAGSLNQRAHLRREKDCSAMTYFLIEELQGSPSPLTLRQWHNQSAYKVEKYVRQNHKAGQVPQLLGHGADSVIIKPRR